MGQPPNEQPQRHGLQLGRLQAMGLASHFASHKRSAVTIAAFSNRAM